MSLIPTKVFSVARLLFVVPLIVSALLTGLANAVEIGESAPGFELPTRDGKTIKLEDFRGKTVYLDFWASWCGPCKQSFPWMNEMFDKYHSKGFEIIAISVDQKKEDALAFLNENPAHFKVALDSAGKTPKLYAIKGMPSSMLIDPRGKVIWAHTGFKPEQRSELEQQIAHALDQSK